jgi:putative heme degradation protein
LAHDADLRARFAAASRQLAESEFSAARIGRDIVTLYDRFVGGEPVSQVATAQP